MHQIDIPLPIGDLKHSLAARYSEDAASAIRARINTISCFDSLIDRVSPGTSKDREPRFHQILLDA
jgi:hypothetical protein